MSDTVEIAIISAAAALFGALLGGLVTFFTQLWQARRADKSALGDRRSQAYGKLLVQSTYVLQLALNMHLTLQFSTGIRPALLVLVGLRRPVDPLELTRDMTDEMKPLYEAWSEVWAVGSQEAIAQANDLVAQCGNVVGAATQLGEGQPRWLSNVTGEKWTKAQLDKWQEEQRALAAARKKFGEIARKETGIKEADLFASNESKLPAKP